MSLSGRHQTLLSIYGAVHDPRRNTPKKPQTPRPIWKNGKRLSTRQETKSVPSTDELQRSSDEDNGKSQEKQQEKEKQQPKLPAEEEQNGKVDEKSTPVKPPTSKPSRTDEQSARNIREERGAPNVTKIAGPTANESAVISLYGDGFLEIPVCQDETASEGASSLGSMGDSGFSITMLLFKAADTDKHKTKVEVDGARHQTPGLDDSGEFVRWLCCGSLNRSMFGCLAATEGRKSASFRRQSLSGLSRVPNASTPKLLAAKHRKDNSSYDETSFVIYDRGVLPNYSEKGEDGGCRVRWKGWECWANNYEVPSNRWVRLRVSFDCRYLQVFFDDELVDCARIQHASKPAIFPNNIQRSRCSSSTSAWAQAPSISNSVYVGGHPSYAKSVRDWRAKIGFVGLISSFQLRKVAGNTRPGGRKARLGQDEPLINLTIPEVGSVRDSSAFKNVVNSHRNVFWRQSSPPIWTSLLYPASPLCGISPTVRGSIVLLGNFFDGAHQDVGVASSKSFENLLLSALQCGDIRIVMERAAEFTVQRSHDHVCRTQTEYEQKSAAIVAGVEQMSPLLNVIVNAEAGVGMFEICVELARAFGKPVVSVVLHSMITTGCFPNLEDVKKKIESIVLFEAKRSPGEEIHIQAFRHLLALASQSRHNRERAFMESVINRKLVLTERKVCAEFERIGFYFAASELSEVVVYLRRIQDNYSHAQNHRMDELPSLSMLTPTPTGLYTLPFMNTLLLSSTMARGSGSSKSPWRFVCALVDHDFQLVDFVHEGCPVTKRGGISYRQGQSIYNGVVDRTYLRLTALSHRVFCVLFSLQKVLEDESDDMNTSSDISRQIFTRIPSVRVQLENVEEHHVLGMFDARPDPTCRWFTLAAAYRSKKNNLWFLQGIGGCGVASSIYGSIGEVNGLLAELQIIQTYEILVQFRPAIVSEETPGAEHRECEEFAHRLAKNIRFGRNGRIVLVPLTDIDPSPFPLRIALKLQMMEHDIEVYTHRNATNRPLPTTQSVYRIILRILSQHGIKECLQQNPFAPQNKKVKRHVEFRVVSASTNTPVEKVHVFIEKNIAFDALSSNLAKTVLPSLMMGSRLMSIRRRLQKKRTTEITQDVAKEFTVDCISKGMKRATIASTLNVKFISVVKARALLRQTMRRRYESIKGCILEQARKSDHAREYSRNFPARFQRLFSTHLVLSESERDLLQNTPQEELAILEQMLNGVDPENKDKPDEQVAQKEWEDKLAGLAAEVHSGEAPKLSLENSSAGGQADQDDVPPGDQTDGVVKDRRRLFISDSEGRVSCRLIPGSYSLYVFHLDYFEWRSLIAVYPTITASGLYSGPTTASNSVQEMVIPLDVFRWTYTLQLVDYFRPNIPVELAGIPLQVTDNCSSERQVVTTDENGCATWEVCKGIYSVDVLRECNCVFYSALKQVIVDGGRYRTSRTINMPVLFSGVKVTVLVASTVVSDESSESYDKRANQALVRFHSSDTSLQNDFNLVGNRMSTRNNLTQDGKDERHEGHVVVGTSKPFKLRLGTYRLEVSMSEFSAVSLPVNISWSSSKSQPQDKNRYLAVLSPVIHEENTYRVVLSYIDGVETMDVIIEVWKDKSMVGYVWRQSARGCAGHVRLEIVNDVEGCEYQSLLLRCQRDFTYKCFVASNISMTHCLRPRVQIYSSAGLVHQCSQSPSTGDLYWNICWWDQTGALIPNNSSG